MADQAQVIAMLQRLDAILIQIKRGLMLSNKPLSLFYKPAHTVIEISIEVGLPAMDEAVSLISLRR